MIHFRYRLSWLLLVPVLLAGVIWWLKPPAHASYEYLASNDPSLQQSPSFYHVKQVYLDRQLLLSEIKDCDYAVIHLGAAWSPTTKVNIQNLHKVSEHYRERIPFFICSYYYFDYQLWLSGFVEKPGVDSYLCIVRRGVITHQFHDYLGTPEEIHARLKRILPWNYSF